MKYIIFIIFIFGFSIDAQNVNIPCKSDENCKSVLNPSEISKCIEGNCMCANFSSSSLQMCKFEDTIISAKQKAMNKDCLRDEDCEHIKGSRCLEDFKDNSKICACPRNTVINMKEEKCLAVISEHLGMCNESRQCIAGLDGADCVDGKCRCRPNFHFSSIVKHCIPNKGYGQSCSKNEDNCYQLHKLEGKNNLICSKQGICTCQKNYVYVDNLCQFSDASRIIYETFVIIVMVAFTIKGF